MEEKNQLTAELDRVRRQMESIQSERDRLVNELDRLRRQASLAESLDLPNLNSECLHSLVLIHKNFIPFLYKNVFSFKHVFTSLRITKLDVLYLNYLLFTTYLTLARNQYLRKGKVFYAQFTFFDEIYQIAVNFFGFAYDGSSSSKLTHK